MNLQPRIAATRVVALLRRFPALAIPGARQIGKSTLARLAFPDFGYVDLEDSVDFARVARDPQFLLSQYERVVIDEAQRLPELFPVLRSHLDRGVRMGGLCLLLEHLGLAPTGGQPSLRGSR